MPHVDADALDEAITRAVHTVVATSPAPPPLPTATVELGSGDPRRRRSSRLVALAAATTVVAVAASLSLFAVRHPSSRVVSGRAGWSAIAPFPGGTNAPLGSPKLVTIGDDVLLLGTVTLPDDHSVVQGAVYSPRHDRWRTIATPPDGTALGGVVWTGRLAVVLGGAGGAGMAAYEPRTDTWSRVEPPPSQTAVTKLDGMYLGVWDGTEIVFPNDALQYDPARRAWSAIPESPLGLRLYETVVWTGSRVLAWGGCEYSHGCPAFAPTDRPDGAAYDPRTRSWRVLPRSPIAPHSAIHSVFAGGRLFVFGGYQSDPGAYAATYDPASDRWETVPAPPITRRSQFVLAAVGNRVVVWGGTDAEGDPKAQLLRDDGAVFDVRRRTWTKMARGPLTARRYPAIAVVDDSVVIWGGDDTPPFPRTNQPLSSTIHPLLDGARYSLPRDLRDQ